MKYYHKLPRDVLRYCHRHNLIQRQTDSQTQDTQTDDLSVDKIEIIEIIMTGT